MEKLTPEQLAEINAYRKVVVVGVLFVILGIVFYHLVEKLSWLNSAYFTVITLSTVGYGDIVPHTPAGKVFTIFYVFVGITIFVAIARIIVQYAALRRYRHEQESKHQNK